MHVSFMVSQRISTVKEGNQQRFLRKERGANKNQHICNFKNAVSK